MTGSGLHIDVSVSVSGVYRVALPVGRYAVTGRSPEYGGVCRAAGEVTVTKGHTVHGDVLCEMK